MNRFLLHIIIFIALLPFFAEAQQFDLPKSKDSEKLRFELVNNLIVLPIEVNGSKLNFLLDSGVSQPILFNISDLDSLQINNVSEITIRGVGHGEPIKALSSKNNTFKLNNITNLDQCLYVVMDKSINLSPMVGMTIHGIMGYELFRDFVVDINYSRNVIKFFRPETYKYRKDRTAQTLPLEINKKKAYLEGNIHLNNLEDFPVTLLVDTGSSDSIWLFEDDQITVPEKNYEVFLGKGLNGEVYGKRTKIDGLDIGSFSIKNAKAAFPDKKSFSSLTSLGSRNGSLGGEVLKRFNVVFDYSRGKVTFKKNKYFERPFQYNLSGLDLQHNGMRYIAESIADSRGVVRNEEKSFGDVQLLFESQAKLSLVPEIVISAIRTGSPAHEAGLREGDVVLAVNGKRIHRYKLQQVMNMLNDKEGKRIKLLVGRYNSDLLFTFVLKNVLK